MATEQLAGEAQAGTEPGPSGMWGTPGVQPPPPGAVLQLPFTYPASHGTSLLLPRPLGLLTQPVPAASALQPLLLPSPLLCAPCIGQGPPAAPPRPRAPASRDSTRALKAWLGQHRRRPYPSRGEKVALALLSRMSLTQVSTWFANARRRLRKEQQARGAPRREPGPQDEGPGGSPRQSSPGPGPAPSPRPEGRQPQLWRLAETAAAPQPEPGSRLRTGGPLPCGDHGAPALAGGTVYVLPPHLSLALPWGPESHWQLPL